MKLPQSVVDIIPPRPPGYSLGRESFARDTGVNFDPLSPAASAINLTLEVMLNQKRAARMNAFHAADSTKPGFKAVLDALNQTAWYQQRQTAINASIQRTTGNLYLRRLMALATGVSINPQVRSQAFLSIRELDQWLAKQKPGRMDDDWLAHYAQARHAIAAMMDDPSRALPSELQPSPPGSPIGN